MKIVKRKMELLVVISLILLASIPIIFALLPKNNIPNNESPVLLDVQKTPSLAVPESPLGTIGLMSGLVAALLVFVIIKKKQWYLNT